LAIFWVGWAVESLGLLAKSAFCRSGGSRFAPFRGFGPQIRAASTGEMSKVPLQDGVQPKKSRLPGEFSEKAAGDTTVCVIMMAGKDRVKNGCGNRARSTTTRRDDGPHHGLLD
jgi:hypothetical protein